VDWPGDYGTMSARRSDDAAPRGGASGAAIYDGSPSDAHAQEALDGLLTRARARAEQSHQDAALADALAELRRITR
jgi:hypothetical protein